MSAKENPMQKIITRCWEAEAFKQKLMADPNGVLKAEGVPVPKGITVKVLEDTDSLRYLVIPRRVASLSDSDLCSVSAGRCECFADPYMCWKIFFF
jgi:hypothetical protein